MLKLDIKAVLQMVLIIDYQMLLHLPSQLLVLLDASAFFFQAFGSLKKVILLVLEKQSVGISVKNKSIHYYTVQFILWF